jgi:hypothetical protein
VQLLLFREQDGFVREPVLVLGAEAVDGRLLLELERLGSVAPAERRSSPRLCIWHLGLRAVLGLQLGTVVEIAAHGLGVEAAPGLSMGSEIEARVEFGPRTLRGPVSVRSARPFGPEGVLYGLLCLDGAPHADDLKRALPPLHRELLCASSLRRPA